MTRGDMVHARLREVACAQERLADTVGKPLGHAVEAVIKALSSGKKLLLFGNGGSAADAQHIASELVGRFQHDRRALPAIALTTDGSALTAIANDFGFERVFARQVEALAEPGDVAVGISTSGESPNVLNGLASARRLEVQTIGLTGGDGGAIADAVDVAIVIPSTETARVQEGHIAVGHVLCEFVEQALAKAPARRVGTSRSSKVVAWPELLDLRARWRAKGTRVVWTNGCFDLLHAGHVQSLREARTRGNVLVVGLNSDDSVRRLKGEGRPLVPLQDRAAVLSALEPVDWVLVFEELTPERALRRLQPDVHTKGAEYAPPDGLPIPEAAIVRSYGGTIDFLPLLTGRSTSEVVSRIRGSRQVPDG